MSSLYGMQRANGAWFAVKEKGRINLPIYRSSSEAMQARRRTRGMIFYRPAVFDDKALNTLVSSQEALICFWLVSNPKADVTHGEPLTPEQLAELIKEDGSHD